MRSGARAATAAKWPARWSTACQWTGIKVVKIGPWAIGDEADENWQFSYLPIPTKQCDTCAARRGLGKVPTCVQHCQSQCLEFGPLDELSQRMDVKQKTLFVVA